MKSLNLTYHLLLHLRYNIRGQLLYINNSTLTNDNGVTNSDANDVFGLQLFYDGPGPNLNNGSGNTPSYNGKLSAVKWMSKDGSGNNTKERSYTYAYDSMNRYTGESYAERVTAGTGTFSNNLHGFDETGISYDAGGNILSLNRNSSTQGTNSNVQIDNLTYTYSSTSPNQLASVADASGNSAGFIGGSGSYAYDPNGSLTTDPYKNLTLSYDDLNRTDKIIINSGTNRFINYTYDGSGQLIRKQAYDNNTLQTTTDYVDGFNYVNGTLSYFPMPEGRVLNNAGTLTQEFIITDQQGNARVSFQNNGSGTAVVKQENSYYAFGMLLPNSPVGTPPTPNKQLYNGGSEWQNDFSNMPDYQQTFYRNYDAAIGRFVGVDPMAESAESMTTYQYAGNNPIMNNDPMGDLINPSKSLPRGYTNPAQPGGVTGSSLLDGDPNGGLDSSPGAGWQDSGVADYGSVIGNYSTFWNAVVGDANSYLNVAGNDNVNSSLSASQVQSLYNNFQSVGDGGLITNYIYNSDSNLQGSTGFTATGGFYHDANGKAITIDGANGAVQLNLASGVVDSQGGNTSESLDHYNQGVGAFAFGWSAKDVAFDYLKETGADLEGVAGYAKFVKGVARGANILNAAIVVTKVIINKQIMASDILEGTIAGATFLPGFGWAIGGAYFLGDIITKQVTGESIGEHLNDYYGDTPVLSWK